MRSCAVLCYAPDGDPDSLVVAWRKNWPAWTWAEFRGPEAQRFRDTLSGAHASTLHDGDLVQVYDVGGHGDFTAIEALL